MTDTVWNDQRVDELKRHWDSGLSSREIAAEMHVTRNTVIGKVARLGLEPRAPRMNDAQKQKRKLAANARHTENQRNRRAQMRGESLPPIVRPVVAVFEGSLEIPFRDLRDFRRSDTNECRFITGDGYPFLACGNPTDVGETYCEHCRGVVYNKALPISDEERERRRRHATRNWAAANVKMYGPAEASV